MAGPSSSSAEKHTATRAAGSQCVLAVPPGWRSNPSRWGWRLPVCAVAAVGFCIAMYLSLVQWGVFGHVWDPFFASPDPSRWANGSDRILHTWISRLLPVPDAFLGALAYVGDMVTGLIGNSRRWHSMPWIVLVFAAMVCSFAAGSIMLIIFQPLLFHAWCFLCLCSAAISIGLVAPALHEAIPAVQHLMRVRGRGESVWRALWGGRGSSASD